MALDKPTKFGLLFLLIGAPAMLVGALALGLACVGLAAALIVGSLVRDLLR